VSSVQLRQLVSYLDEYLDIANTPDYPGAENGLQVQNSGSVEKLVACTDACQATIDAAAQSGADLMVVHHGLFWGKGVRPLTDRNYQRIKTLVANDIAVYSAHLPLDAHAEVGNNAELARGIGLDVRGPFAEFEGHAIGLWGELEVSRDELVERLYNLLGSRPFVIPAGPERTERVGVLSGGGAAHIADARREGLDTFITGEGPHHSYFDAQEWRLNVLYGGHYATETLGVKALTAHVASKFELEWEFIDHPTGL
jgi:dinuclear metal center YbgI/SA1388 family protein